MSEIKLDPHSEAILQEYRDNLPVFEKLQATVPEQIRAVFAETGIVVASVESRIKAEDSLAGKLELKGTKYASLADITDIFGVRIITFYTDDVDKVASVVDRLFEVDWDNSVDKRRLLDLDRFGYMSLHYICRLPLERCEDPEMHEYRFEVQMRTALQHVWATINHDLGYKTDIEIPREHLRNMNRIAGMLELADEQFSRIRMEITDYRRQVQALVADGDFDRVPLDGDTFRSYLELDPFHKLADRIASINQAEIYRDNLMPYLQVLLRMGFKTLGDLERLLHDYSDDAYQLALHQISGTDLDIMALSVTLQNLCCVYALRKGAGVNGLEYIFNSLGSNKEVNHSRAERLYRQAKKINIV
jgi:ppGpp synthetase/RelA/SpoT-type nucleotidyltranferase